MAKQWQICPDWPGRDNLAQSLRISPILAQLLHHRNLDDPDAARTFLKPTLKDLEDPD